MSVEEVGLLAMHLEEGERIRDVCPFCKGGRSGERSMNIAIKDGLILFNCHRASCQGGQGAIKDGGIRVVRTTQKRKQNFTPFTGELTDLPEEWAKYLEKKVGFSEWHIRMSGARLAIEENRVAFPIYGPMGLRRGYSLRSYESYERCKSLTRMDVEEPHLSHYRALMVPTVIVVEDIPSAVRASRYVDAVALLGTGCNTDYATEISSMYRHVVWALDQDATEQALRLMRKHALLFETSRALFLEEDIKDMKEEALCKLIGGMGE